MKNFCFFLLFMLCGSLIGFSQTNFRLQNNKKSDKVRFKLINNLIIIPVEINHVELSFILDTGVSKPIVFSFLNQQDTLQINNTEAYILRGLGEGESFEALKSKNNFFKIGEAINLNQDMYAIHDANLNFTPQLGISIHGIIGFDLFKDFVVEINYAARYIKLHDPETYSYDECDACEIVNLEFYNNKPYLNAEVKIHDKIVPVKLLIDSGGSDALWIFEDVALDLYEDENYFIDFLGNGLSGSVYGKRAKVQEFILKSFTLKSVNVAFPDSTAIQLAKRVKDRNGSISGNILKRFNLIVDYRKARLTLKKNKFYSDPFSYNKSGIELEHLGELMVAANDDHFSGKRINIDVALSPSYNFKLKPAFTIVEIREGSPAERAGLLIGDVVLTVNNRQTHQHKIHEIIHLFYGSDGEGINLTVDRNGFILKFMFRLESPLK
ncbi:PDZ domain-containing protein [Formosa sp. PL04]|uniref:PDZ domain-containing protein n=1 Tax=Formosa sp. PL04 TaxID=3081755 RepID=UPI0029824C4C|nr:PDZ domain-containing protein [Formosa sp. PL04]MDW5287805.1 PDZ domain-containing protein [Formosa sp. PL04]